jgi:hypothetical protein
MLSSADILNNSANLLERDGVWIKGNFFRRDPNSPIGSCMCAHGAIAYCGDAEIRQTIDDRKEAGQFHGRIDSIYSKASNAATYKDTQQAERLAQDNEILWAHYRAVEAGCSIQFNDAGSTTRQQVINKLRQAAKAAEVWGNTVTPEDTSGTFGT